MLRFPVRLAARALVLLLCALVPAAPGAQPARVPLLSLDAAGIQALPAGDYELSLSGSLNTGTLRKICAAIAANSGIRASLDLSQVTGLAVIDRDACSGCGNLTALTVPDAAVAVHAQAFSGCTALAALHALPGAEHFSSRGGVLYSKDGARLLLCPPALSGTVVLPAAVADIADGAFALCGGVDALGVESGNGQFSARDGCLYSKDGRRFVLCAPAREQAVAVAGGVERVERLAFAGCARLGAVTLPDSIREIGERAFNGCASLAALEIPPRVAVIGKQAFAGCARLESLVIPGAVTAVGSRAFYGCALTALEFERADGWQYGQKAIADLGDRARNPEKFAFPGKYWPYDIWRPVEE